MAYITDNQYDGPGTLFLIEKELVIKIFNTTPVRFEVAKDHAA